MKHDIKIFRQSCLAACLLLFGQACALPQNSTEATMKKETEKIATFAGGCFWCMQPAFDGLEGVISTTVGYTGGTTINPTYEEVCSGSTGHLEAIEVKYNPEKIRYWKLLVTFLKHIDPTVADQQFADHGHQYQTAIFYHDAEQKYLSEAAIRQLGESGKFSQPIAT